MEPTKPIAVAIEFDKLCIRFPYKYGCNDGFTLCVVEEVVWKDPYRAIKDTSKVNILMRSTIMAKIKLELKRYLGRLSS